jgi:hypothetical protein
MTMRTESLGIGMKNTAMRWHRVKRAMKVEDQVYAEKLSEMIARHEKERLTVFEDPLEAALFAVLIELLKEIDRKRDRGAGLVEWMSSSPEVVR